MAEFEDREHYIPLRKGDLIELISKDPKLPEDQKHNLKQFCKLISAIYHFEYMDQLENLKEGYAPFDPDRVTKPLRELEDFEREHRENQMFDSLVELMERANFKRMTKDDILAAVEGGASDWGINMDVCFDVFERLEVFARGDGKSVRKKRRFPWFWKWKEVEVDTYDRLVMALKLTKHKRLPDLIDTKGIYVKLFKDIPKLDMEMVLPGTSIQMGSGSKWKLGLSLISTLGYIVYKLGASLVMAGKMILAGTGLLSLGSLTPVGLVLGYGYKQYAGYQMTKQQYAAKLTESLYYQTLDNNAGVLNHLIDEAEEQECREAILAYFCLWLFAPEQGWTQEQLDDYVEIYLEDKLHLLVDFEVDDAMEKVLELNVVEQHGEYYKAVPIETALERLDHKWDNYFQYNV